MTSISLPESPASDTPVAAAIVNTGAADIDERFAAFARQQIARGRRVHGLTMVYRGEGGECAASMVLVDIRNGQEYLVSQDLGPLAKGCRADPAGFAEASRVLREALDAQADLVVCNRFGALELQGQGFADELLQLMAAGIPLLTIVSARHLEAWKRFSGDAAVLPDAMESWQRWLDQALGP